MKKEYPSEFVQNLLIVRNDITLMFKDLNIKNDSFEMFSNEGQAEIIEKILSSDWDLEALIDRMNDIIVDFADIKEEASK